jgi:hypothetical protein
MWKVSKYNIKILPSYCERTVAMDAHINYFDVSDDPGGSKDFGKD